MFPWVTFTQAAVMVNNWYIHYNTMYIRGVREDAEKFWGQPRRELPKETQVQILDEAHCLYYYPNPLGKRMNSFLFALAIGK